jgi:transcriptional regulator NrdR family protein
MSIIPARTRRSQLACPRCGTHKVSVRDTVAKGHRILERYRICEACRHLFKTREAIVSDYREAEKAATDKALS